MGTHATYKAREFNLSGLTGISDKTLETHFKLYAGYVKGTNDLNERINELTGGGSLDAAKMPQFSELTRRLGWEYNGMVLHEYYFENLQKQGGGDPDSGSGFRSAAEASFGSYEAWKLDFNTIGKMRGIGWTICFQNPADKKLTNVWVEEHHIGNIAGFSPVLVMDVWEHAFILDYAPADRPKYIEAFFSNINWNAVNGRVAK